MDRFQEIAEFVRAIIVRLRQENVTFMAGSIAYQAFVSLVPLLVLTIFFLSIIGGEQFATETIQHVGRALSPNVKPIVRAAFRVHTTVGASVIGLITLIWGSFRVFRGLDTAFSEIYGTHSNSGLFDQFVDGLVAIVALLGALFATTLAATVAAATGVSSIDILVPLLLVGGLIIAFFPMYWRFPDTDVSVQATIPGVLLAAIGWAALQAIFEIYLAFAGKLDVASVLSAILLLSMWLYFDSLILLIGAVVNAVIADHDR